MHPIDEWFILTLLPVCWFGGLHASATQSRATVSAAPTGAGSAGSAGAAAGAAIGAVSSPLVPSRRSSKVGTFIHALTD